MPIINAATDINVQPVFLLYRTVISQLIRIDNCSSVNSDFTVSANMNFALCEVLNDIGVAFSFPVKDESILNLYDTIA